LRFERKWDLPGPYVKGIEQGPDGFRGAERGGGRLEAAKVQPQLPVRESLSDLVSPANSQRGLAYARGSCDRQDRGRAISVDSVIKPPA